jgi:hypothetical protein
MFVAVLAMLMDGTAFTVTFTTAVEVQPEPLVPATVYEVVVVGVTTMLFPGKLPGFQV